MTVIGLATIALAAIGILLLFLVLVLLVEVVAALATRRPSELPTSARPQIAVLVPAHDEALTIGATVAHIRSQLRDGDRILVVADNCTDATHAIARTAGAETVVRTDMLRRGKGFALAYGVRHLAADPPDVVIVNDADSKPEHGAFDRIAALCARSNRPVQAHYDIVVPNGARTHYLLFARFASRIKNFVRPLGYHHLGLPCQLMGTGMAFPWHLIGTFDLATSEIVEDLVYGLEFARSGHPPLFCPDSRVTSPFPIGQEGQITQRERWETGHINTIVRLLPSHFIGALRSGDLMHLALVLDAAVPPLALLALGIAALTCAATFVALLGGGIGLLMLASACGLLLAIAILVGWWRFGKDVIDLRDLALAPVYVLSKMALYGRIVVGRKVEWIRSKRDVD